MQTDPKRTAQSQARKNLSDPQIGKILGETKGPAERKALIESLTRKIS